MKTELILSVQPAVPMKGSNAGKPMFVINGKYWMKSEPKTSETHIITEEKKYPDDDVKYPGKTFTNAIGYSADTRMPIAAKIEMLTSHDVGYSQAIAILLK